MSEIYVPGPPGKVDLDRGSLDKGPETDTLGKGGVADIGQMSELPGFRVTWRAMVGNPTLYAVVR